jgi:adenosylmethionine-8-amino-7-oxononanoate aminotransferase
MGGTIDGRCGDHVLLAPPFVVTQGDLGEIVGRLKESINGAVGWTATPSTRSNYV